MNLFINIIASLHSCAFLLCLRKQSCMTLILIRPVRHFAREIRALYCVNHENKSFIPEQILYQLMTKEFVLESCGACQLPFHAIEEVVEFIMDGARKLFAVLVLISEELSILKFIGNDQFLTSKVDHKMPFSIESLNVVDEVIAPDFFRQQWELCTPSFTPAVSHRVLDKNIILPFLEEVKIDEGSFGVIYEVVLHPSCHRFYNLPVENLRVVRKSFKPNSSGYHDREIELQNLATLKLLKDPCIVQLLGSYTYREEHSFLFPLACGGDLSQLLIREPRPAQFGSDDKLLLALLGLAKALEKVHYFSYSTFDINLIGCHHDLKPKNILVHGDSFLLADFGLSKFKTQAESSKTTFQIGGDYYLAPECEEYEGSFQRHRISRPADIWSFGCIVAEIVTYMNGGRKDVQLFKDHRQVKIGRLKTYTFHAGYNTPNGQIHSWLSRLEAETTRSGQFLVHLVRRMLSLNPEDRPKAKQVSTRIAFIAAYEIFTSAKSLLSTIALKSDSFEVEMESIKLDCYGFSLGFMEDSGGTNRHDNMQLNHELVEVFEHASLLPDLLQMRNEMQDISLMDPLAIRLQTLRIRYLVDQFWSQLPRSIRARGSSRLESAVANSCNMNFLQTSKEIFQDIPTYRRLALLASIKRTTLLVAERMDLCPPVMRISEKDIQIKDTFEVSNTALVSLGSSRSSEWALIEWLYYDCEFNEELLIRVEAITELLGAEKPTEFLGLDCAGFYHDPSKPAFGLVFPFPEQYRELSCSSGPLTLAKFIEDSQNVPNRPFLGDRFKLARRLAESVLEFHKVGWLHKCLSSFSVILFYPRDSKPFVPECFERPFIIGFSHSRPDEPNSYTKGPKGNEREEYQHPDYAERKTSFEARYDYYSLGIILLEIGLWMSVVAMRQRWKISTARKLRKELIDRRVPLLDHSMGQAYCQAVSFCLTEQADTMANPEQLRQSFEQEVIERLASCAA